MTDTIFRIGDKLDSVEGRCFVEDIEYDKSLPVRLRFEDDKYRYVTADGKFYLGADHPCVWFLETGSPPVVGERPRLTIDKPTWCRVWREDSNEHHIRLVVHAGIDYYKDAQEHYWSKAEPCSKDEIPDWWPSSWT